MKIKSIVLSAIFVTSMSNPVLSQGMTFTGLGPDSSWSINGQLLDESITTLTVESTLSIERDGVLRCRIAEPGLVYYPVTMTYQVPEDFAASNRSLVGQPITLNMVFSSNAPMLPLTLPTTASNDGFGLRRRNLVALDNLSRDSRRTQEDHVPGFIAAMFATKYYDSLLSSDNIEDRYLLERRRVYFAQLAANFLFQQHEQNAISGEFDRNPIILPDGDAYDLLTQVLTEDEEVSRRTVLGTRYRSFWLIRDLMEKAVKNQGEIPQNIWEAAQSLSVCVLEENGLDSIDGDILSYLRENKFYVPIGQNDLLIDPGSGSFNMWRVLYIDRFGELPDDIGYEEALNKLLPD